jgi:hypothetical protein
MKGREIDRHDDDYWNEALCCSYSYACVCVVEVVVNESNNGKVDENCSHYSTGSSYISLDLTLDNNSWRVETDEFSTAENQRKFMERPSVRI